MITCDTTLHKNFRVLRVHPAGSSRPLVVECGGALFFVKLKAGLSGQTAIVSEWLACQIGVEMGLPMLAPRAILFDETTDISHIYVENRELIQKSFGLNVAFPFLENATPLYEPYATAAFSPIAKRLFIFDLLWLNMDRTVRNTNLLQVEDQIFSFDYESSLLIGVPAAFQNEQVWQHLRQNPLYATNIGPTDLDAELERLKSIDVGAIVRTVPTAWLSDIGQTAQQLTTQLTEKFQDKNRYFDLLAAVKNSHIETEEARKGRILANRLAFEQRLSIR